jgi:hypothetical protein
MSIINKNSRIHIVAISNGKRFYLHKAETKRNARGELVLWPMWSDDAANSNPLPYEFAVVFKRRMRDEHKMVNIRFAQSAGDTAELIEQQLTF